MLMNTWNRFPTSLAALAVMLLLLIPMVSRAQSAGVSITPDPALMTSSSMGFPNPAGGPACMLPHAAAFRVALTAAGNCITNITIVRPVGTVPAAPNYFSACVDQKTSRYTSDVTPVSVNVNECNPHGGLGLVIAASGPGTLRVKVTTSSADHGTTQTVTTQDVVIP